MRRIHGDNGGAFKAKGRPLRKQVLDHTSLFKERQISVQGVVMSGRSEILAGL